MMNCLMNIAGSYAMIRCGNINPSPANLPTSKRKALRGENDKLTKKAMELTEQLNSASNELEGLKEVHSGGDKAYGSMVAITWEPGEMTGLYSPLLYGKGDRFGKLFKSKCINNKITRHVVLLATA